MLACSNLGLSYRRGTGVAKDEVKSAELYQKACAGDYLLGCSNLAYSYLKGIGIEQGVPKAIELFTNLVAISLREAKLKLQRPTGRRGTPARRRPCPGAWPVLCGGRPVG